MASTTDQDTTQTGEVAFSGPPSSKTDVTDGTSKADEGDYYLLEDEDQEAQEAGTVPGSGGWPPEEDAPGNGTTQADKDAEYYLDQSSS